MKSVGYWPNLFLIMPPNPYQIWEPKQLSSTLKMTQEYTRINLSTSPSLESVEKQFLKVSTIVWMLKESGLKDQVSLSRHIRFQCLQDHQTPAEKVTSCEKKSILWKPMCGSKGYERTHSPKCNEGRLHLGSHNECKFQIDSFFGDSVRMRYAQNCDKLTKRRIWSFQKVEVSIPKTKSVKDFELLLGLSRKVTSYNHF
jgi:hypothetical protein